MKASEVFEGEGSSLHRAYVNAVTPEKETPTLKTVEEVVRSVWDTPMLQSEFPSLESRIQETVTLLQAQNQAADERLREVVKELFAVMDYQNTERELNLALQEFKLKFAAKHGITNL